MNRVVRSAVTALVLLAVGGGCVPKSKPIRGAWTLDEGNATPIVMTFHENGTYVVESIVATFSVRQEGSFTQTGSWLYMNPTKVVASDKRLQAEYDKLNLSPFRAQTKWQGEDVVRLTSPEDKRSKVMRRRKQKSR